MSRPTFKPIAKALPAAALACALGMLAPPATAALDTIADLGSYTVTYDATSFLGSISFGAGGGAGSVSFGWNYPITSVDSVAGLKSFAYTLPEFIIAPNAGYALSGPVSSTVGNLNYVDFLTGTTSLTFASKVSVDGGAFIAFPIALVKAPANAFTGTYSGTGSVAAGGFGSYHFYDATLTAVANVPGAGAASVTSQSQNQFSVAFIATAVPELESYLMFMAGLGLIGAIALRRRAAHTA